MCSPVGSSNKHLLSSAIKSYCAYAGNDPPLGEELDKRMPLPLVIDGNDLILGHERLPSSTE